MREGSLTKDKGRGSAAVRETDVGAAGSEARERINTVPRAAVAGGWEGLSL